MPFGDYVDTAKGLNCCVSSWRRVPDEVIPARGKLTGSYLNAALAKSDALESGFDEAILLTQDGHVSEGSAENVFMLRAEEWATPPVTDDILEGVTRRLLMTLMSEDLGMRVVQRSIDRSELFVCEELYLCGTGAQVAPVIAVDHRKIGGTGGVGVQTSAIQERYFKVVRGDVPARFNWLVPTYAEPLARP